MAVPTEDQKAPGRKATCGRKPAKHYRDKFRKKKRELGVCLFCPSPAAPNRVFCRSCAGKAAERGRKQKERAVAAGLCSRCYKEQPGHGFRTCETCRSRLRGTDEDRLRKRCRERGITPEQYRALLRKQGGRCAICLSRPKGRWNQLDIDHCHGTGRVRGLLCHECNKGMGCLGDDADRLESAARYLRAPTAGTVEHWLDKVEPHRAAFLAE